MIKEYEYKDDIWHDLISKCDIEKAIDRIKEERKEDGRYFYEETPLDWFSKEDIIKYLDANYQAPETEEEEKVEQTLLQIIEEKPEVLKYFAVSEEWKNNGILDKICEIFKLDKMKLLEWI